MNPELDTLIEHLKRDNIREALEIAAAHGWGSRQDDPLHPSDGPTVVLWRAHKDMEMDVGFGPIGSSLTMELGLCGGTPHCRVSNKAVPVEVFAAMLLGLYVPPAAPLASVEANDHARQVYEAIVALSTLSRFYNHRRHDDDGRAADLGGRIGASLEIALDALHKAQSRLVALSSHYDHHRPKEKP